MNESLQCTVGAQVERNLMWQTVTHGQTRTFSTNLHTLACILGVIISPTVANSSFYWTNSGMFNPVLFHLLLFKKCFSTESAEWIHPWSRVNTVHSFIAATLYSFWHLRFALSYFHLFRSLVDFNAQHISCIWPGGKDVPSQTATHSLHRRHHIS